MLQKQLLVFLLVGASLLFHKRLTGQEYPKFPEADSIKPVPPLTEIMKRWGPNDTVLVPAIWYRNEIMSYREEDMVWISNLSPEELRKHIEAWNRLRNAVYVTYPYARVAGTTINQINSQLEEWMPNAKGNY